MRRRLVVLLLSGCLVLLTALPTWSGEPPIQIGLSLGLTGRYAEFSRLQEKGFRLWERDVNARGGILGRQIFLSIADNASDPIKARSLYEFMITQEKKDLLFLPYSSELTEAVLPVTEKYAYPVIASGATGDRLWNQGHRHFFGLLAPTSRYTAGFLELILKNRFTRVALLYADDPSSLGIAQGAMDWSRRLGLNLVYSRNFRKGTSDFVDMLTEARLSKADVVMVCAYLDEAVAVRLSLKNLRWQPKAYFAAVGATLPAYRERLVRDAERTFTSSLWESADRIRGSQSQTFSARFQEAYGEPPSYHAISAYAAGQLLEQAIRKAGSLDRTQISYHLATMEASTLVGRYSVDKDGRQTRQQPIIVQWQKGKKEVVWPRERATAISIWGR